jgi:excisionase family DNA binding protein
MSLTLEQAAEFLNWKPRTLLRKIKDDPTLPVCKKGKEYRFIQSDIEEWIRAGYSGEAKKLLGREECTSEAVSTTSALEEYESLLKRGTASGRKGLNTNSTRRRGTVTTG